jgi:pantothenate kinase-related protein Tda10
MTSREAAKLIDAEACATIELTGGTLYVNVRLLDFRQSFGRVDALVTPLSGGTKDGNGVWVSMDRISLPTA